MIKLVTNTYSKVKKLVNTRLFEIIAVVLLLVLGFAVRTWKIGNPIADWHSWRQADTASVARIYRDEGINLLYPKYYDISTLQTGSYNPQGLRFVEFPIYSVIHAEAAKLVPQLSFEVWGRLISIICSLFSAYFLYRIGKKLSGKWVGLVAAFLFLFIPYNIYYSRVILPEPMGVALGVAALWFFMVFIENENIWVLFLSGILLALSSLLKPFIFVYALPMLYLAIKKYGFWGIFKKKALLVFADLALAPFFAWRIWENHYPTGIPGFDWAFNSDGIRFRPAFWFWIFGERIGKLILGVWGMVPFSVGLIKTKKSNLTGLMFVIGVLLYVFIIATANVRHDYYQILLVPALALVTAQGVIELWNAENMNKVIARVLCVFSVFVMLVIGYVQAKDYYQINHYEIVVAGQAVDKLTPKNAIVIAPYNGDTAFLYQTKRYGFPIVDRSFDEMINKYHASIFVTVNFGDPDTAYVENHYKVLEKTGTYMIADLTQKK